jgi:hypothetical protein
MNEPIYLLKVNDNLHGYWTLGLLLIDLTLNKHEHTEAFQLKKGLTVRYERVSKEDLRADYERGAK